MSDPESLLAEAHELHAAGRVAEALAGYEEVLRLAPDHPDALNLAGKAAGEMGDGRRAWELFSAAVAAAPEFAEAHDNLGLVLAAIGRHGEAAECHRRAGELEPDRAEAFNNLGIALIELGRVPEAAEAMERAVALAPDEMAVRFNQGRALHYAGRLDEAEAALRRARELGPGDVGTAVELAKVLQRRHDAPGAIAAYREAAALDPGSAEAQAGLAEALLQAGDGDAAIDAAEAALARRPGDSLALLCLAMALRERGDGDGARRLLDYDRLARSRVVAPPPGFADLGTFNAALRDHVLAHPTLAFEPYAKATRHGRQTGELLVEPKGPIAVLEALIREAVADYGRTTTPAPGHPFPTEAPPTYQLTAWAPVLADQGHQLPHAHPGGWLSGVYYVQLPDVVGDGGADHAGWFEFGRPPPQFAARAEPETRLLRPEEGLMTLFPSYFPHRTLPFRSATERISIAFDVRPVGA